MLRRETRVVHGHTRAYLVAGLPVGTAPVLWLIHGIGDSSLTWHDVIPLLEDRFTIIAPDLLGHGHSDKPRADYSVAGFANGMRDLMVLLGIERATVVGHSLGGGVACQFAYQYPERVERLVLVAAGGMGAEVNPVLRLLALPGAATALGLSCNPLFRRPVLAASKLLAITGLLDPSDVEEVGTVWNGLRDRSTRSAFLRTLRTSVDVRGQAMTSRDRLYLTENIPTLVVWGKRDPVLPVRHAKALAETLPGAVVRVVNRAGHMPHRSNPPAFATALANFVSGTSPAVHDQARWSLLLAGEQATVLASVAG